MYLVKQGMMKDLRPKSNQIIPGKIQMEIRPLDQIRLPEA